MKPFELVALNDRRFQLVLPDAPEWCHALEMAPEAIEPDLEAGAWLVLAFAVWSGPDIEAVRTVLSAAESMGPSVQVGIRPFDDHSEMRTWLPEAGANPISPIWALLVEGRTVWTHGGLLTPHELLDSVGSRLRPR